MSVYEKPLSPLKENGIRWRRGKVRTKHEYESGARKGKEKHMKTQEKQKTFVRVHKSIVKASEM